MPATDFQTWNPVFNVQVLQGKIGPRAFLERVLRVKYVDRIKEYDQLEMDVLNHDGLFSDHRSLSAGMIIAIKLGYIDGTFPWKVFVLNRQRGGVGVRAHGEGRHTVGKNESVATLFGRNRNAKGGKMPQGWKLNRRNPPGVQIVRTDSKGQIRKSRRAFAATSDLMGMEMQLGESGTKGPRIIVAKSSSAAVQEIARRAGFNPSGILVQTTSDHLERIEIPAGRADADHLQIMADQFGFQFKIDDEGVLHWHSPTWEGDREKGEPVESSVYGAGQDLLKLSIDSDFRLPMPKKVKRTGVDPKTRKVIVRDAEMEQVTRSINMGTGYVQDLGLVPGGGAGTSLPAAHRDAIMRNYVYPALANSPIQVSDQAKRDFIHKLSQGFMLSAEDVGNPRLQAGKTRRIGGTGSIFCDGVWLIGEAHHTLQPGQPGGGGGIVYGTNTRLKLPPEDKRRKDIEVVKTGGQKWWQVTRNIQIGTGYVTGRKRMRAGGGT